MLFGDIDLYKKLITYLETNTLLKIYNSKQRKGVFDSLNFVVIDFNYKSKTVYRNILKNFSVDKEINTNNYDELTHWLRKDLELVDLNNDIDYKIYTSNMSNNNYDFYNLYKTILFIINTEKISKKYIIEVSSAYINEYEELLLFSKGIIEYRYNKLVVFSLIFKDRLSKKEYQKNISFSYFNNVDEVKKKIIKIINGIIVWEKYDIISTKDYKRILDHNIMCLAVPTVSSSIIHESIGHFAEADVFNKNKKNQLLFGKQIFNDKLNISDIAYPNDIPTQFYVDDDGIECSDVSIISNGVLLGVLSDQDEYISEYYKIAGFKRGGINGVYSIIRMRNTVVFPGESSFFEMLKNIREGLILYRIKDSMTSYDGNFSIYIEEAFYVVDGQIKSKISNIQLAGSVIEFLKSISMIGDEIEWTSLMYCNKEQMVNFVSGCSPAILCNLKIVK